MKKIIVGGLAERMKEYENSLRYYMPKKTYVVFRIDGKAFHTFTKGLERPFCNALIADMNTAAAYICKNVMGAKFAYVQSDEISIVVSQEGNQGYWFENCVQKMVSVIASMATRSFNEARLKRLGLDFKWAEFDARVFILPNKDEVVNYFVWRQQDATKNSIASVAQNLYSSRELHKKNTNEMQEMVFQKGLNWNDFPFFKKRGRVITKVSIEKEGGVVRNQYQMIDTPIFLQDKDFLFRMF